MTACLSNKSAPKRAFFQKNCPALQFLAKGLQNKPGQKKTSDLFNIKGGQKVKYFI